MKLVSIPPPATAALIVAPHVGCSANENAGEHESRGTAQGVREHDRDSGEHDREGGEESGAELALSETHDAVRNGVRLVLAYDAASQSFRGTIRNTTERSLARVRVEVHLSNGKELGPTTPVELGPGATQGVVLGVDGTDFDRWTAHAEVGSSEHGHGEGGGEHGGESEHD